MTYRELIEFCDEFTNTPAGCSKCPYDRTYCETFYEDWGYYVKDFRPESLLMWLKDEYLNKKINQFRREL